jgi:hypothetical protein
LIRPQNTVDTEANEPQSGVGLGTLGRSRVCVRLVKDGLAPDYEK